VISLLALAGLILAVVRWHRAGPERALVVMGALCLVMSFGHTTFGSLVTIIPGHADIFFRRFLMGSQLAAIYLAGLGAVAVARLAVRLAERCASRLADRPPAKFAWTPTTTAALAAAVGVVYLYPAWHYLEVRDAGNGYAIKAQELAQVSRPDAQAMAAVRAAIRQHGPGRAYAGTQYNRGQYPAIGAVPMYAYLESLDIDEVGYTLRTAALMSQPEYRFNPENPGDYALFGIRYVILPAGSGATPPPGAVLILRDRLLRLYELPGNSYIRIADTVGSITANRADIGTQSQSYLNSAEPGQDRYLTVGYAGAAPAPPTLLQGTSATGPPGTVITEHADLADGTTSTTVQMRRRAVVVLSASFDPGWSVTIDGKPATPEMIAPALVGVTVPPGTHQITFRYTGFGGYPELFALAAAALIATAWLTRRPLRTATAIRIPRRPGRVRGELSPCPEPWRPASPALPGLRGGAGRSRG
jgi:hypothetical protein